MNILSAEFKEKVKKELQITDLITDNQNNLGLQHFYLQLYINSKSELIKLDRIVESCYKELYNHYRFEFPKVLKSASEIDIYIKGDEKYKKVKSILDLKTLEVKYLEEIIRMFQNRAFAIKNAIELEKLKS